MWLFCSHDISWDKRLAVWYKRPRSDCWLLVLAIVGNSTLPTRTSSCGFWLFSMTRSQKVTARRQDPTCWSLSSLCLHRTSQRPIGPGSSQEQAQSQCEMKHVRTAGREAGGPQSNHLPQASLKNLFSSRITLHTFQYVSACVTSSLAAHPPQGRVLYLSNPPL